AALGLDALYLAFDVPGPRLRGAIAGIRGLGLRQVSVSIPHKTSILELVDAVDATAARIGAANTVVHHGDRLVASNTDWIGAGRAIERECPLSGAPAVVLRARGTARAPGFALLRPGASARVRKRTARR